MWDEYGSDDHKIIIGDNLSIMRDMPSESVDLIATDPPFNTGRDFGAYRDGWKWDRARCAELHWISDNHVRAWNAVDIARSLHSDSMGAFLCFLAVRVLAMHRVLKPTGSLYLHCDQTANSYIRLVLDAIFGPKNFINQISWCYKTSGKSKTRFNQKHDTIFFYAKNDKCRYYSPQRTPLDPKHEKMFRLEDEGGKYYISGKGYKYYRQDANPLMNDWWDDIYALGSIAKERVGYPTQKPIALYQRIIQASSNEGDLVLDPFVGSGTTVEAAFHLNRRAIGLDINPDTPAIARIEGLEAKLLV